MSTLEVRQFSCLKDNYGVLIHDRKEGVTAAIDAPEAAAMKRALDEAGWRLTHILVTHHHADHTGGIGALKAETGCRVIGPAGEEARIPGIDQAVQEPDEIRFGGTTVKVLDTPGHTIGHITYWIPEAKLAFVGDTLFAMGCGRVLEGTAEMMWASLSKLAALPRETSIYCGHEYTLSNGRFALSIDPDNAAITARMAEAEALRAEGKPTLPTLLADELRTNVFLRADEGIIRDRVKLPIGPPWKVFAELRERKNKF